MELDPRRARLGRWGLSAFLVFHLVASGASFGKKTELGAAVRTLTAPYERALGIWQSWGMFGPPPGGSSWMMAAGLLPDGREIPLEPLVGELSYDRTEVHYDRVRKVERNMFDSDKAPLRRSVGEWLCRQQAERGQPLVSVRFWKEQDVTPSPRQRRNPDFEPTLRTVPLQTVACP